MEVRDAIIDDARRIAEVHVRSWQAAYRGQLPDDYLASLSVDQRESVWREILGTSAWPASGALVVTRDANVVGFAHLGPSRDADSLPLTGELTAIYLAPEVWGQGGGRALIRRAVDRLREATFTSATLWVLDSNSRARRFYEAGGWLPDGAQKVDEGRGFPIREVRHRRRL